MSNCMCAHATAHVWFDADRPIITGARSYRPQGGASLDCKVVLLRQREKLDHRAEAG